MKILAALVTIITLSLTGCIIESPHCHGHRHGHCHAPPMCHPPMPMCHQPCPQPIILWGPGCTPPAAPKTLAE